MTDPNKAKGDTWERAVRDHCRAAGFPWTERTRAGYARDHGDLHLVPGPAVIAQAKNHARICLPEWLAQLDAQLADSGAEHGFLAVKRRGIADPGRAYAVLELDALLRLLRHAGYGEPIDPDTADTHLCHRGWLTRPSADQPAPCLVCRPWLAARRPPTRRELAEFEQRHPKPARPRPGGTT